MPVGKGDELVYTDACRIADLAELIGKGDVDIAICVLHQLAHLRRHVITDQTGSLLDKAFIQILRHGSRHRILGTDDAVIVFQFIEDPPRQYPLRAVSRIELIGPQSALLRQQFRQHLSRIRRDRRFQYDEIAFLENAGDQLSGTLHIAEICPLFLPVQKRCRNTEDVDIGSLQRIGDRQRSALVYRAECLLQLILHDVDVSAGQTLAHLLLDIIAFDVMACLCQYDRCR